MNRRIDKLGVAMCLLERKLNLMAEKAGIHWHIYFPDEVDEEDDEEDVFPTTCQKHKKY